MKKIFFCLFFFLSFAAEAKLKVVTTFSILEDFTKQIAQDKIELKSLVGANSDIHAYQLSPSAARLVGEADLVIINGVGFDDRLVTNRSKPILVATKNVRIFNNDPHAWQDVTNAKIYVETIAESLKAADPSNAEFYQKNAKNYLEKLDELDVFIKKEIAKIPAARRAVVTSHNAFQYYARAYNIEFIPLLNNTDSQPSARVLADTIDKIRARQVKIAFIENIADPRLLKQLEYDAKVKIAGILYSDALFSTDGGYIEMMQKNSLLLVGNL